MSTLLAFGPSWAHAAPLLLPDGDDDAQGESLDKKKHSQLHQSPVLTPEWKSVETTVYIVEISEPGPAG